MEDSSRAQRKLKIADEDSSKVEGNSSVRMQIAESVTEIAQWGT